jgi:hypothetical protein
MADKTSSDKDWKNGDCIISQRSTATLSKAFQALIADILSKAGEQAEFDKDIFTKLVDLVKIKSREDIVFILKDGTEVRAGIM